MLKYSLYTKLKAVNDELELGMSAGAVAKLLHSAKVVNQKCVEGYEKFGIDGLLMKLGTYTGDFKINVVEYIHENSMSIFQGVFILEF